MIDPAHVPSSPNGPGRDERISDERIELARLRDMSDRELLEYVARKVYDVENRVLGIEANFEGFQAQMASASEAVQSFKDGGLPGILKMLRGSGA